MKDLNKLDWNTQQNIKAYEIYALMILIISIPILITGIILIKVDKCFSILIIAIILTVLGVRCIIISNNLYKNGIEEEKKREEQTRLVVKKAQEERSKRYEEKRIIHSAVPRCEIKISSQKIPNIALEKMQGIKLSRPRNGQKKDKYGNFIVIDVETTGLKKTEKIIEVAAVRYKNFTPIEVFNSLLDPQKPIPSEASRINHITDDMVRGKPTYKSIIPALEEFIGSSALIGHNLSFDLEFLYRYGYDFTKVDRKYYDTYDMAKSKLKKYSETQDNRDPYYTYDVENYKLGSLCMHYDIEHDSAHRALGDCFATAEVFIAMLNKEYKLL